MTDQLGSRYGNAKWLERHMTPDSSKISSQRQRIQSCFSLKIRLRSLAQPSAFIHEIFLLGRKLKETKRRRGQKKKKKKKRAAFANLDLHLLETVLPEGSIGGDTVVTEVNENVPVDIR